MTHAKEELIEYPREGIKKLVRPEWLEVALEKEEAKSTGVPQNPFIRMLLTQEKES